MTLSAGKYGGRYVGRTSGGAPLYAHIGGASSGGGGTPASTIGVTFTLTANLAGTHGATAAAEVIASNGGLLPGDPITVTNTGTKKSYTGCTGHAIKIGSAYWISEVQQMSILSRITFSGGTHQFTAQSGWDAFNKYGDVQIAITTSSFEPVYGWPLNFLPSPRPTIYNPHNLCANAGDTGLLAYDAVSDQHRLIQVFHQAARGIVFRLTANWPNGVHKFQTSAEAVGTMPGMGGALPAAGFTLRDRYNRAHHAMALDGARPADCGHAVYNYSTREYDIIECSHRATEANGTIRTTASGTPTTFGVNVASTGYENGSDPTAGIGWLTVQNRYGWASVTSGKKIEIKRDPDNGEWYPVQMGCP